MDLSAFAIPRPDTHATTTLLAPGTFSTNSGAGSPASVEVTSCRTDGVNTCQATTREEQARSDPIRSTSSGGTQRKVFVYRGKLYGNGEPVYGRISAATEQAAVMRGVAGKGESSEERRTNVMTTFYLKRLNVQRVRYHLQAYQEAHISSTSPNTETHKSPPCSRTAPSPHLSPTNV